MRLVRILASAALAAIAITVIAVPSASAAAPEFGRCLKQAGGKFSDAGCTKSSPKGKFEWTSVILHNKFNGAMKKKTLATLETVGGTKITCTAEENRGAEFSGAKNVSNLVAHFSGCETSNIKCNSEGQASGNIITSPLKAVLGRAPGGGLELQITPESGTQLTEFRCGVPEVRMTGCLAGAITPDKMLASATVVFAAQNGEQSLDKFAGGPEDECALTAGFASSFEEAGESLSVAMKFEERIEASSVN